MQIPVVRSHRSRLVLSALAMAMTSAAPVWSEAASCGGTRECRCGDHVVEDYRLPGDLGPCPKDGLILRGAVTLDGGGNAIRGSRAKSSVGVVLDEKSGGSRVVDLEVTGFARGVRLAGVSGARVEKVESHHNGDPVAHKGYGIDVARAASNNVVENVHVHHNADEGIHIGNGARGNRVASSRFENNYRENVYFLENDGNSVEGSTILGGSASSVFVKHARNVRIEGNRIDGRGIQVRGASSGVTIRDNQIQGGGLVVQPYEKGPLGKTVPQDVTLAGGRIRSDDACVRLVGARSVRLDAAGLDCADSLELAGDSDAVAIDTTLRQVICRGPGVVREERRAEVRFVDAEGAPVAGVEVDGGPNPAARSGKDGVFRGTVALSTTSCPGPRTEPAGGVTIRAGEWSRTVPARDLSGEIRVGAL